VQLSLEYEPAGAGPATVVAKMPAGFEPSRRIAVESGLYRTETSFYRELAPRTPPSAPTCYWAGFDAASGGFILLLEDLGGLKPGNHDMGCSEAEALAAATTLGRVHARWWGSRELAAAPWLGSLDQVMEAMVYVKLEGSWPLFLRWVSGRLEGADIDVLTRVRANLPFLRQWSREAPPTLGHGDYRLENFFFEDSGAGGRRVVVLDWQLANFGPGARDLAYFAGWNLLPEQRRRWETSLLTAYHRELEAGGVPDYGIDRCGYDYRLGLLTSLMFTTASSESRAEVVALAESVPGPAGDELRMAVKRNDDLMMTMLVRSLASVRDSRACDLLPA